MTAESHVHGLTDGKRATRRLGRAILALANLQHGVMSRAQLRALGVSAAIIDGWIASARLIVIHRGVSAVGHRLLSVEAQWMAGVLAGGEDAALSHRAAGDLWQLTGLHRSLADVTVQRRRRSRPGICFREHPLPPDEVTERSGIAVTTVARTLLDLAAVVTRARLEWAISVAEARRLGDSPSVGDLIRRYPGRRGGRSAPSRTSREPRGGWGHAQRTRDRLPGLPAAERDRSLDLSLAAAGYRTARVTWRRVHSDADGLEVELRAILAAAARRRLTGGLDTAAQVSMPPN